MPPNLDSLAELVTTIEGAIPHVLTALKYEDARVRAAAVSAIAEFSKQCKSSWFVHVHILIFSLQPTSSWRLSVPCHICLVY
jgi:hypothetical protein